MTDTGSCSGSSQAGSTTETKASDASPTPPIRGRLFIFEGLDRSGKTTQSKLLAEHLGAKLMKFPFREGSRIGGLIDEWLRGEVKLDRRAVHLLFVADRFQHEEMIRTTLAKGQDVVIDRYSYSGTAYALAEKTMDWNWVQQPEAGLPQPDHVFCFLPPLNEAKSLTIHTSLAATKTLEYFERVDFLKEVEGRFRLLSHDLTKLVPRPVKWTTLTYTRRPDQTDDDIAQDIQRVHKELVGLTQKQADPKEV